MSSRDLASLAIDLSPHPARVALAIVMAVALFAAFQFPVPWCYLIAILLLLAAVLQAWHMGLMGRRFVVSRLLCDAAGQWWVVTLGDPQQVKIDPSARMGSAIIWLVLEAETRRIRLLLLPSSMSDASWRGLQTRLRWLSDKSSDPPSELS